MSFLKWQVFFAFEVSVTLTVFITDRIGPVSWGCTDIMFNIGWKQQSFLIHSEVVWLQMSVVQSLPATEFRNWDEKQLLVTIAAWKSMSSSFKSLKLLITATHTNVDCLKFASRKTNPLIEPISLIGLTAWRSPLWSWCSPNLFPSMHHGKPRWHSCVC